MQLLRNFNPHTREGCDLKPTCHFSSLLLFQSTHPRRVRHYNPNHVAPPEIFQSTHPRRVRRGERGMHKDLFFNFNPHTREGCDYGYPETLFVLIKFQSTHPRRVRLVDLNGCKAFSLFQSTHPRRVRLVEFWFFGLKTLFQSTHPRRVRLLFCCFQLRLSSLFQSTHPRRVRPGRYYGPKASQRFQSTHPRRVRR